MGEQLVIEVAKVGEGGRLCKPDPDWWESPPQPLYSPIMASLLLSFDLYGEPDETHRQWVRHWLSMLRQRELKALITVAPDTLLYLEQAHAFDLLDLLAWHESGLFVQPPTVMDEPLASNPLWWRQQLDAATQRLASQAQIGERLLHQPAIAIATAPRHYTPQLGLAASRLSIPFLVQAPFEDKAPGTMLSFTGCGYICRHHDMHDVFIRKAALKPWLKQLQPDADQPRRSLLLGADLSAPAFAGPKGHRGHRGHRGLPLADLEAIGGAIYSLAKTGTTHFVNLAPPQPVSFLSPDDLYHLAGDVDSRLRPLQLSDHWYGLSDLFSAFVQAGVQLAGNGSRDRVYPLPLLGPLAPAPELGELLVRREELFAACVELAPRLVQQGYLPSVIRVAGLPTTPSAFLYSLARAIREQDLPQIKIPPGPLPHYYAASKHIRLAAEELAEAHDPPVNRLLHNAIIAQCWTAKPLPA